MTTPFALVSTIAERIPASAAGSGADREAIAATVALIAERFRPERIVLYGSRVYGEPRLDSDIDLMVIIDTSGRPEDLAARIREAVPWEPVRFDVKVRTPAEIRLGLAEGDFFIEDVMTKGVTLYARDGLSVIGGPGAGGGSPSGNVPGLKRATQDWLDKAEGDHQSATHLLTAPNPRWDVVCYLAQQYAEKYLKALLQERGIWFPRTHDLVHLANLATASLPSLTARAADLKWLTDFAIGVRYPGKVAGQNDATRALDIAGDVRREARAALGVDPSAP